MSFWKFQNKSEETNYVELQIEGEIVSSAPEEWDWLNATGSKEFNKELSKYDGYNIKILLNSEGGDVIAATSIYNNLKRSNNKIEVELTGFACSAATIIMMAGDKITMPNNSLVMIHDPAVGLMGYYNEEDLNKQIDALSAVKKCIINSYSTRIKDQKKLSKLMSAETWLTADECLEMGLIDEILHNNIEIIEDNNSLYVNNITYKKDFVNNNFKKNIKNIKNYKDFFKKMEVNQVNLNKKNEIIDQKEAKMDEDKAKEINVKQILDQERQRIAELNNYKNKIDNDLINQAINEGWDVKELTYQAMTQDKLINQTANLFEQHKQATNLNTMLVNADNSFITKEPKKINTINDAIAVFMDRVKEEDYKIWQKKQ